MRSFLTTLILVLLACVSAVAQQPIITGLSNNYSYIPPGMPNYGIAQGSIFDIFGSGLASSTSALQAAPLQAMLNDVSVAVTVSGVTTHPPLYFVSTTQIAAVLPSNTPVGTGQIIVTSQGQASAPATIQVVRSAFGILTQDASGSGMAAASDATWTPLGPSNAVNPGEYITLWGSGAGPAAGDDAVAPTPADLKDSPMEVEIGGHPATVLYHGRSSYPGVDQVNVLVPAGVSGCNVSVAARTGDIVSNFATIPVAASGRTCSDPPNGLATAPAGLTAPYESATLSIMHSDNTTLPLVINGTTVDPGGRGLVDQGASLFMRVPPAPLVMVSGGSSAVSVGSCGVGSFRTDIAPTSTMPGTTVTLTYLDAGTAINVTGPLGTGSLRPQGNLYTGNLGSSSDPLNLSPAFVPAAGGTFRFDNGSGGKDIPSFTAEVTIAPTLVWTNIDSFSTVSRSGPLTVTWQKGQPNSQVEIIGYSYDEPGHLETVFYCKAPVEAGSFTIPQSVLLTLPKSVPTVTSNGVVLKMASTITLSNMFGAPFAISGVDRSSIGATISVSKEVLFQ